MDSFRVLPVELDLTKATRRSRHPELVEGWEPPLPVAASARLLAPAPITLRGSLSRAHIFGEFLPRLRIRTRHR